MKGQLPFLIIFGILILLAVELTGGMSIDPAATHPIPSGTPVNVGTANPAISPPVLQLLPLAEGYPEPQSSDRQPAVSCGNTYKYPEDSVIIGIQLPSPITVTNSTQIKLWAGDEGAITIGATTYNDPFAKRPDINAKDERTPALDYYPAMYLTKLTSANQNGPYSGDAENGGTPVRPSVIDGEFRYKAAVFDIPQPNGPPSSSNIDETKPIHIADDPQFDSKWGFQPIPDDIIVDSPFNPPHDFSHVSELIWDLSQINLNLDPHSTYRAEFIVHDGDLGFYTCINECNRGQIKPPLFEGCEDYCNKQISTDVAEECITLVTP